MHSTATRILFAASPVAAFKAMMVTLMLSTVIVVSHFLSGAHDAQRLLQLAFLGVACACIVATGRFAWRVMLSSPRVYWPLALFFAIGAVSSLVSDSPLHALREVLMLVLLLVIAMCVAQELHTDYAARVTIVLHMLGAGVALYIFKVGVIWATAIFTQMQPDTIAFTPEFSNFRFLNHVQTISLPLIVLLACRCNLAQRRIWLGVAMFWAFLLLALSGRGTVLGLLAGCAAAFAVQRGRSLYFCKSFLLAALGGIVLFYLLFVLIPRAVGMQPFGELLHIVVRSTGPDPTSYRNYLWARSLVYIAAHPWLGIGPAHFGRYAFDLDMASHPHDWPLQIALEWGIPALLCLLAVIGAAGRGLLKASRLVDDEDKPNQLILSALIVTGVAILVDGLVSGLIVMPVSQLLIALYVGCAAGWVWALTPRREYKTTPAVRVGVSIALFACVAGLFIGASHDFTRGSAGDMRIHPDVTYGHPRFWLDEYFTEAEMRQAGQCGHGKRPACP